MMTFPLHIFVSNQSLEVSTSEIIIELDGQKIFNKKVETGTQHKWERITLNDTSGGEHDLVAHEINTNSTTSRKLTINNELWILVIYYGPPRGIKVDVRDQAVAFM
jgi:hypothetical protein